MFNQRSKKRFIAILLFVSCLVSGWLLFLTPVNETKQLHSFAEADSLLHQALADFNIQDRQISSSKVQVDSSFSRRKYTVSVPPAFSKTQFHAVLKQKLAPYSIQLPAHVTFPEKNMAIHFYYADKVFGTVRLVTNEDLRMQRTFASLVIAFKDQPNDYLVDTITGMGEPVPLAIIMRPPLNLPDWWRDFRETYDHSLFIWPQTADGKNLLAENENPETRYEALDKLEESSSSAVLLHFFQSQRMAAAELQHTPFAYVAAPDAFILDADVGRSAFEQTFRAFIRQARQGRKALGIIIASEESLEWTQEELNTYKKGGLIIAPPRKTTY